MGAADENESMREGLLADIRRHLPRTRRVDVVFGPTKCGVQELTGHCFLFLLRGKVQPGCICSSVCRHRESFSLNRIHRGRPDEWSRVVIPLEKRRQEHAVDRGEAGGPLPRNPQ